MTLTLPKTKQEIVDFVYHAIINQGQASVKEDPLCPDDYICMYRGPLGLKCAIGHLIPDDVYSPKMENNSVLGVVDFLRMEENDKENSREVRNFLSRNLSFLEYIQFCHDNAFKGYKEHKKDFLTGFKNRLASLCKENNLKFPGDVDL